jgi:hypothetical protein
MLQAFAYTRIHAAPLNRAGRLPAGARPRSSLTGGVVETAGQRQGGDPGATEKPPAARYRHWYSMTEVTR